MTLAGTARSGPGLISPTVRLRDSWLASREERGRDARQDGTGLRAGDDVDSAAGFARWAGRLAGQAATSRPAGEGRVHASYWQITEDGIYLGAITLRHELNDFLFRAGGHIGYGIRPICPRPRPGHPGAAVSPGQGPGAGPAQGSGDLR